MYMNHELINCNILLTINCTFAAIFRRFQLYPFVRLAFHEVLENWYDFQLNKTENIIYKKKPD